MEIVKPLVIVEDSIDHDHIIKKLEYFTRKCYQSDGRSDGSIEGASKFVERLYQTRKHRGISDHRLISVTFITDRGVSHEQVRHRLAAYLQESTRYVSYGHGCQFVLPHFVRENGPGWKHYLDNCRIMEDVYKMAINSGAKPEEARYWLPQGIKTEYVASMNLTSWHRVFEMRTPAVAHPQIRQLAIPLLRYFKEKLPELFNDIETPSFSYEEAKLV